MININKVVLSEKEQNILQILNELIREDNISPTLIVQRSLLSPATVSRVLCELQEKNLVVVSGEEKNGKGRRPKLYSFNKDYGYLIHFTLETGVICGYITDLGGQVLGSEVMHFTTQASLGDIFDIISTLSAMLRKSKALKNGGKVLAAGMSVPGVVSEAGRKVYEIPDIPVLNGVSIYDYTEKILGVPVVINNTSRNAVLGEKNTNYIFTDSLAYFNITGSKGIGVGLIIGNKLVRGCNNYAGEIGMCYGYNGLFEEYQQGGCYLEDMAGMTTLNTALEQEMARGGAQILREILKQDNHTSLTLGAVEQAVRQGDEDAGRIFDKIIKLWAMSIINMNYLVNPDFIVLGGCITSENQLTLQLLNAAVEKVGYFRPELRLTTLGNQAELFGGVHMLKEYAYNNIILNEAVKK